MAGPKVAARQKLTSEPKLSARNGEHPSASAASLAGDSSAAATPTALAAIANASGDSTATPTRDGSTYVSGVPASALVSAKAGSTGDSDAALGDPVAALAAHVNAAIEARKTYPEAALRRGTEGVVALRLRVAGDGRLLSAKLEASSGSSLLDRAALDLASSVFPVDNLAGRELELVVSVRYELKR